MNVLVLNTGSSSLKFQVIDTDLDAIERNADRQLAREPYPLPVMMVGGANGQHKGGKHVVPPEHTPIANLHLTELNKIGSDLKSFGDSTGLIAGV
mgnify:CR=1 FL=1